MDSEGDRETIREEPVSDCERGPAGYEPPEIVRLGSVDQLTAGNQNQNGFSN